MITKSIELNIKDIDMSKREAVIAHATYKTLDGDGDRSNRGMFDKSWKEKWNILRFFLNHKKDQAPGKPLQAWDDSEHAYTRVKLGTHSLGDDVLKMLDEGVIVAASFGFDPTKFLNIKNNKGKDFKEVIHYETSVLTHWGAHEESGIVKVEKAIGSMPKMSLKQLNQAEQDLLNRLIDSGMTSIMSACETAMELTPDSDLYTYIMWFISRQSDMMGDMRSQLRYGMKEGFENHVAKMQRFIRNTTASDEAIATIQKSLSSLLNKSSNTAITTDGSFLKCPKCTTYSSGIQDEAGCIKCAECNHVIKHGQQDASGNKKDELRRALLKLKAKMVFSD